MATERRLSDREKSTRGQGPLRSAQRALLRLWHFLTRENTGKLLVCIVGLFFVGAVLVRFMEQRAGIEWSLFDAFWWVLVTMTTVGYGDIVPTTLGGRVMAGVAIFSGVIAVAVFTAKVASVLTAQKIKEDKGLEKMKSKGHVAICGWNFNAERVIDGLARSETYRNADIVLVNDLPEETIGQVVYKYQQANIHYVRGDFTQESVLEQANIAYASAAIILADIHGELREKADERTILATLAIKSMAPEVKVCAELLERENEEHLLRADVDDVIVSGEYSGFLLVAATTLPGIPQVVRELLTYGQGNVFRRVKIPAKFAGATFRELSDYFGAEQRAILVGIITEEHAIGIDDILTDDYSMIDQFIREKFEEAGRTPLPGGKKRTRIHLNPGDDYVVGEKGLAVVISREPGMA